MGKWLAAFLVALVPVHAVAQVNTLPSAPHLLVKGHAEVRVVPNRFTIHLNVDVTDMSPNVAREKVEAHMGQLFKALDTNGALKGQTHASSLSIQPQTDYEDGKSVFKGTDVSRSIDTTFDNLDKLRAFIAAVPADKEVQIGGVQTDRAQRHGCHSIAFAQRRDRKLETGGAEDRLSIRRENHRDLRRFGSCARLCLRRAGRLVG